MRASLMIVVVLASAPGAVAAPRAPMSAGASQHYQAGLKLYTAGQYRAAYDELIQAERTDSRPEVLYALGQTLRKLEDCKRANLYFSAYLEVAPSPQAASAARSQMNRCLAELAEREAAQTTPPTIEKPEPVAVEKPEPVAVVVAPPPRRRIARDPLGGALLGSGLVVVASGAGLLGWSDALSRDSGATLDDFHDAQRVPTLRITSGVLVGIGGAAVIGSIARYVWLARHRSLGR